MGQKRQDEMPLAVAKAYAYAREAQRYGYSATVKIETSPTEYYSDGDVMFPASVVAWVQIHDEWLGSLGDTLCGGWRSVRPGQGRNATTRFIAGWKFGLGSSKKDFANEREFGVYVSMDSYREKDPAKYGIIPEADRITAPAWTAEDWDK